MSKKRLPKTVRQTAEDMRRAGAPEQLAAEASRTVIIAPGEIDERQRQSQAHAIVERYANFSAVGGVIPLPLLNVAAVTTLIVRMVKLLSQHYGVPYQHGRARALVVGLAVGSMPTTAAAVTTSTLVYIVPGVNLLGLAVSSVTASACARGIGRRFVDHFETGGTLAEFPVIDRR